MTVQTISARQILLALGSLLRGASTTLMVVSSSRHPWECCDSVAKHPRTHVQLDNRSTGNCVPPGHTLSMAHGTMHRLVVPPILENKEYTSCAAHDHLERPVPTPPSVYL